MTESEFESIVEQTKGSMFSAIYRYLNRAHHHFIDDVAQEVYFSLFKQLKKKPKTEMISLSNYVYTMTKNECIRLNKKEALIETQTADTDYPTPKKDETPMTDVFEIISKMPEKTRVPLTLFLQGFSINEIGRKLNLNLNTVKSLLFRGREGLVKRFKEDLI